MPCIIRVLVANIMADAHGGDSPARTRVQKGIFDVEASVAAEASAADAKAPVPERLKGMTDYRFPNILGNGAPIGRAVLEDGREQKFNRNYTPCILPTTFLHAIETGKLMQRATIPSKLLDLLESKKADQLTQEYFCIFCARNGLQTEKEDDWFFNTRDPQDLIEELLNQYESEELTKLGGGLNAAIRTYVNWHKNCMFLLADFFEHRTRTVNEILLDFHYRLPRFSPQNVAGNTVFANRYYSYAMSMALAVGYRKAFGPAKQSPRGEARRIDAGRAWTIYSEVETLFFKYIYSETNEEILQGLVDEEASFLRSPEGRAAFAQLLHPPVVRPPIHLVQSFGGATPGTPLAQLAQPVFGGGANAPGAAFVSVDTSGVARGDDDASGAAIAQHMLDGP